jgi:hypothetical protein
LIIDWRLCFLLFRWRWYTDTGSLADDEHDDSWETYSNYDDKYYTFEEFYVDYKDYFNGNVDAAYDSYFENSPNPELNSGSETGSEIGS